MIVIKTDGMDCHKDSFEQQKYKFYDFLLEFTEEEYRAFTDLLSDTKEDPIVILQAIIEEGLWSIMQPE